MDSLYSIATIQKVLVNYPNVLSFGAVLMDAV